jgi:hypothetical protein
MIQESVRRLQFLCDALPARFKNISETDWNEKPNPDKWSKKEILGHLIDSATNNHQRFIRGQFENDPIIGYDQNQWNLHSHYNQISAAHLISFWTVYNRHLVEVIKAMPEEKYLRKCLTGETPHTLEWLVDDYVKHLEYHLKQITAY